MNSNNMEKLLNEFSNPSLTNDMRVAVVEHLKKSAESTEVSKRVKAVMNGTAKYITDEEFDIILKEAEKREEK